jgi:DNA-binding transcriptional ArsR family regulator
MLPIMPRPAAAADVFTAVADPTRRAILDRLRGGDMAVHELAAGFDVTRPAISRHLRVLRDARLVRERRAGRERVYRLTASPLRDVARWASGYEQLWSRQLSNLKRHLEARDTDSR